MNLGLTRRELDELPTEVLEQLSKQSLLTYVRRVRGDRSSYRNLYEHSKAKAARLQTRLEKAEGACKRMAEQLGTNRRGVHGNFEVKGSDNE